MVWNIELLVQNVEFCVLVGRREVLSWNVVWCCCCLCLLATNFPKQGAVSPRAAHILWDWVRESWKSQTLISTLSFRDRQIRQLLIQYPFNVFKTFLRSLRLAFLSFLMRTSLLKWRKKWRFAEPRLSIYARLFQKAIVTHVRNQSHEFLKLVLWFSSQWSWWSGVEINTTSLVAHRDTYWFNRKTHFGDYG